MRGSGNILHFFWLAAFLCLAAKAEPQQSMNGGGGDPDRLRQTEQAIDEGSKKTDQLLQPQKMMHDLQKMEHLRRADEARNNKDFGTANEEEQKAMMEQMKSQQLQQQITTNKDTAQKNREGAEKLKEKDKEETGKSYDPTVVTVRDGKSTQPKESAAEKEAPATPAQVADLSSVPREAFAPPPPATQPTVPTKAEEPAAPPPTAKSLLGDLDRLSVTFDDNAKVGGTDKTPQIRLLSAASSGAGGSTGTPGAGGSGGASSGDTNIWEGTGKAPAQPAGTTPVKTERGLSSILGAGGGEAGNSALGALDKDFFEGCPGPETWKKMSRGEKNGLKESCRKVATKCEKEEADATKGAKKSARGARKKIKLSAQCREWKEKDKDKKDAAKSSRRAQAEK